MNLDIPSLAQTSHNQAGPSDPALHLGVPRTFQNPPFLDSPSTIPMQHRPGHPTFAESLTEHRSPSGTTIGQEYPSAWPGTVSDPPPQPTTEHEQINEAGPSMARLHPSGDWVFNVVPEMPAWFAQEDFDLDGLNSAVMTSANQLLLPEDAVQREWFTYTGSSKSGHITPEIGPEQTQVDETYRANLAVKLQHHVPASPLPSTDFLNMCIQTYFTQFHPVFPVIHAPTLRPSANRSLLLLSICSIGSLVVGLSHAKAQGVKIFETHNKAILYSVC
ncbi:hypothetical protein AbraIFM66950_002761 [Aspergillus brasiliensis]|nr:hypothetical protein AbraIFM66950_002761 [Aspergillus brasiliensis]